MPAINKKVLERYNKTVPKFQRVLEIAQGRDINEADTVSITQDILAEVFGFDKYLEITSEYAIRNSYCDLAIKFNEKIQYLIEVKAIGLTLKENHLRQVIDYGANLGVQWVVLTNGITWNLYKIRFEKPINYDLVSSFNFLELNARKTEDQEKLFLLSKKGVNQAAREDYYERIQSVNRFVIGAIVLSEPIVNSIRRDIRKLSSGIKIDVTEIEKILKNEVLKRDVIEGEDASKAISRVRRLARKTNKSSSTPKSKQTKSNKESNISLSDQLLKEDKDKQDKH